MSREPMKPTEREMEMARELCTYHKCYGAESCNSCLKIAQALATYGSEREAEGIEKAAKVADGMGPETYYMNTHIALAIRALKEKPA